MNDSNVSSVMFIASLFTGHNGRRPATIPFPPSVGTNTLRPRSRNFEVPQAGCGRIARPRRVSWGLHNASCAPCSACTVVWGDRWRPWLPADAPLSPRAACVLASADRQRRTLPCPLWKPWMPSVLFSAHGRVLCTVARDPVAPCRSSENQIHCVLHT